MSLRIKSFEIATQTKEADEFLSQNKPITNGGIQLNMGYIVVIYEDGVINMNSFPKKFQELIGKEIETIEEAKHKIVKNNFTIKEIAPKGYKETLKDTELRDLLVAEGNDFKTAKEKIEAIVECENSNRLCVANITRSQNEIKLYEQTIKSYK